MTTLMTTSITVTMTTRAEGDATKTKENKTKNKKHSARHPTSYVACEQALCVGKVEKIAFPKQRGCSQATMPKYCYKKQYMLF